MNYFIEVEGLYELEIQEKWEEARELLYKMWENDKLNSKKLIRLLFECWYVLAEWNCINTSSISRKALQDTLIECTDFGIQNFMDDVHFLCVAGYMISLFPYLFYNHGDGDFYTELEQKGLGMLRKACELNPNDRIAMALNLGFKLDLKEGEYNEVIRPLSNELAKLFPRKTAIETYFKNALTVR